jgi:hypothetical protein
MEAVHPILAVFKYYLKKEKAFIQNATFFNKLSIRAGA